MAQDIKIAIVGLGNIGSRFISKISEFKGEGISIVAAAEPNPKAPGIEVARKNGVNVYSDESCILELRDHVDIIFDLTGDKLIERSMRLNQIKKGNHHTIVVPTMMAQLIWKLISKGDLGWNTIYTERLQQSINKDN